MVRSKLTPRSTKVLGKWRDASDSLLTPLMRQYRQLKAKQPDSILLFRVGDFFETYFEDAEVFARETDIVLTRRPLPNGYEIPMAGVPFHSVDNYIKQLVSKGYKVAIAEQLEDPSKAKGLVKRDIIQVITAGTLTEPSYTDNRTQNFLGCIVRLGNILSVSLIDFLSRQVLVAEYDVRYLDKLIERILAFSPSELLYNNLDRDSLDRVTQLTRGTKIQLIRYTSRPLSEEELRRYIQPSDLYKLEGTKAMRSIQLALKYFTELNPGIELSLKVEPLERDTTVNIDASTLRNLEVLYCQDGSIEGSLFWALDKCLTPMGSRLLRARLIQPSRNIDELNRWLDLIESFCSDPSLLRARELLQDMPDIERTISKLVYRRANLQDIYRVNLSIEVAKELLDILEGSIRPDSSTVYALSELLGTLRETLDELQQLHETLSSALKIDETGQVTVRHGFDPEIDELIELIDTADSWLEGYQERERQRTGIRNLKIGYNQVFGYYIEVTKSNLHLVPPDYERKQTLRNAERFVTPILKEFEVKYLTAKERLQTRIEELTRELREQVIRDSKLLDKLSQLLAELDLAMSLAVIALERDYVRPELTEEPVLQIEGLRHPVLELLTDYVPTSLKLDSTHRFMILTGPNMGGKSTFLRAVGLITLMAHIGSFVPARSAKIGLVDGIYSRMGASDDIKRGRSTFMVEMLEMAYILRHASPKSLILLDEIGRGTSTYDGLALAWAITEYIVRKLNPRAIFATHFYQLTTLENRLKQVFNTHVKVAERDGKLVFLYEVEEGALLKSYGIEVAKLAGIDSEIIRRAKQLLDELEVTQLPRQLQLDLFSVKTRTLKTKGLGTLNGKSQKLDSFLKKLAQELTDLNPDNLRPIDALQLIYKWREHIKEAKS